MWGMIKEWLNRNKGYLMMLVLSSLAIGVEVAALSAAFPGVLSAFAGLTLFGVAPLTFLTTLSVPLAAVTLGIIMSGISSVLLAASLASMKQLVSMGTHIYPLLVKEKELKVEPMSEASYDFLNKYLKQHTSEHFDDVDDDEFHELSSDCSDEEKMPAVPLNRPEVMVAVEPELTTHSISLR